MAMTAISRLSGPWLGPIRPRALIANRYLGLVGSAALFVAALAGLAALLPDGNGGSVRMPLGAAFRRAPPGWYPGAMPRRPARPDICRNSDALSSRCPSSVRC